MNAKIPTGELISKYHQLYLQIKPVFSPAINELVYFNNAGFHHLVYKRGHRRAVGEISCRLSLVPLIVPVIKNCAEEVEIRIRKENIKGERIRVTYYALEANVGRSNARVRVVTRKVGEKGKHYFQSIMKY